MLSQAIKGTCGHHAVHLYILVTVKINKGVCTLLEYYILNFEILCTKMCIVITVHMYVQATTDHIMIIRA